MSIGKENDFKMIEGDGKPRVRNKNQLRQGKIKI